MAIIKSPSRRKLLSESVVIQWQTRAGQGRAGQGKGRQDLPTDEHRADELLYKGVVLDVSHCL